MFGATSSPGCASYGFKYIASQEKETYPSAARFVTHYFYVDDGLACVESAKQAKDLTQGAREICNKVEDLKTALSPFLFPPGRRDWYEQYGCVEAWAKHGDVCRQRKVSRKVSRK